MGRHAVRDVRRRVCKKRAEPEDVKRRRNAELLQAALARRPAAAPREGEALRRAFVAVMNGDGDASKEPNAKGVAFYKAIEATLDNIANLPVLAEEVARNNKRRLRFVSTPPLLNSPHIMSAVKRFAALMPDVRLALEQRNRLEIEDWVTSRQVDLAFALLPSENPLTMGRPCVDTEAVAVVAATHPLAGREEVSLAELARQRLILPNRQPLRYRIDAMFPGETLDVVVETTSSISLAPTAAPGIGVAVCEPFSPPIFIDRDIRILRIRPAIPLTYGILLPRGFTVDPLVDTLIGLIREETAVLKRKDDSPEG